MTKVCTFVNIKPRPVGTTKLLLHAVQQIEDHFVEITEMVATQTDEKLRRENIKGKARANRTHSEVGAKVRQTIKELGGTMPENLPAAESIKKNWKPISGRN